MAHTFANAIRTTHGRTLALLYKDYDDGREAKRRKVSDATN
jgi:hypothetical protein